jgi:ribonuclease-3
MNFDKSIPEIERRLYYSFKDKSLLRQAFTRTSYANEKNLGKKTYQSNEVLEFIGDSALSLAIVTLLTKSRAKRYENGLLTDFSEGDFSNIKSKLSDKKNLSEAMGRIGLEKYLIMGEGDVKLEVFNEPSVKEDLFESIIGAIYIDAGYSVECVMRVISKILNIDDYQKCDTPPMQSYKNELQEWCADKSHKRGLPVYKTLCEMGPDHKKIYRRAVFIDEILYGEGEGKNQKAADAEAAKAALLKLKDEYLKSEKTGTGKSPAQALKEYAASQRKPSPIYRDRGEVFSSGRKNFSVECVFDGICERGEGMSKAEAKSNAILKVLKRIADARGQEKNASFKSSPKRKK